MSYKFYYAALITTSAAACSPSKTPMRDSKTATPAASALVSQNAGTPQTKDDSLDAGTGSDSAAGSSDDTYKSEKTEPQPDDVKDVKDDKAAIAACQELKGSTYVSLEKHEGGLGPEGVVMIDWILTFQSNTFELASSDVGGQGSYVCEPGKFYGLEASGEQISASLNTAKGILTWNGIDYAKKPTPVAATCDGLDGSFFVAKDHPDTDRTKNSFWQVVFKGAIFESHAATIGEPGSYICVNGKISGKSSTKDYFGVYDQTTGTLIWNDFTYTKQ